MGSSHRSFTLARYCLQRLWSDAHHFWIARGVDVSASKLVFCDLAACEPVRTGYAAARSSKAAADAAHVSKSLLALGNVIGAATNPRRNNGYVPYRDSLLTRMLQVSASLHVGVPFQPAGDVQPHVSLSGYVPLGIRSSKRTT